MSYNLGTKGDQYFFQTRNQNFHFHLLFRRRIRHLLLLIRSSGGSSSDLLLLRAFLQKGMKTTDHEHDEYDGDGDDEDTDL
jgi:hypothetical protein